MNLRAKRQLMQPQFSEQSTATEQTRVDLLAIVSHDLRNPLTAIIGYSDLLAMGVPEPLPAGSLEQVQKIRMSARQLLHLLNELLAFTRHEGGREKQRVLGVETPVSEAPVSDH